MNDPILGRDFCCDCAKFVWRHQMNDPLPERVSWCDCAQFVWPRYWLIFRANPSCGASGWCRETRRWWCCTRTARFPTTTSTRMVKNSSNQIRVFIFKIIAGQDHKPCTVRIRNPTIRKPDPFENRMFLRSGFQMVDNSKTEQNVRFSIIKRLGKGSWAFKPSPPYPGLRAP